MARGADTAASVLGAEWLPTQGMGHDLPPSLYRTIADAIERTACRTAITAP